VRRTPLKRKRDTPRRKAPERTQHQRIKRRAGSAPTAAEKRHMDRIAAMPCLVCGAPANIHHVISDGFQRITRTHRRVTPLCRWCHQDGPQAVHAIGHAAFNNLHGFDLLEWADREWEATCERANRSAV
jgi:hypothetical protein